MSFPQCVSSMEAEPLTPGRWRSELGELADPRRSVEPLRVAGQDAGVLLRYLRSMLVIRFAEEEIAGFVDRGLARAPCHLGIGQEAVAVGVSTHLSARDRVFGGHRSHSHFLALGGDLYALLAEVLGKLNGASRGMGGSMHLFGRSVGFYGSVPLVGATISIAVGAGLAAQLDGGNDVSVAYFGDGATEEGVFHESLNLAATFGLPVLFICENNLFSSHLDINLRQPSDRVARYADAHKVRALTMDGNDVVAVAEAAGELVKYAREGRGPAMLEAVTYRHRGHVGPKEDIDVGVRRKLEDVQAWKQRDPIGRLTRALLDAGIATEAGLQTLADEIRAEVQHAAQRSEAAAYPPASALLDCVFSENIS